MGANRNLFHWFNTMHMRVDCNGLHWFNVLHSKRANHNLFHWFNTMRTRVDCNSLHWFNVLHSTGANRDLFHWFNAVHTMRVNHDLFHWFNVMNTRWILLSAIILILSKIVALSTQSHYPDTEPTRPFRIPVMPSIWLGSDKYKLCTSLVWLDHGFESTISCMWGPCSIDSATASGSLLVRQKRL